MSVAKTINTQWANGVFSVFYFLFGLEATETFVVVNFGLQNHLIGARCGVIGPYLVVYPNTNLLAGFCGLCIVFVCAKRL